MWRICRNILANDRFVAFKRPYSSAAKKNNAPADQQEGNQDNTAEESKKSSFELQPSKQFTNKKGGEVHIISLFSRGGTKEVAEAIRLWVPDVVIFSYPFEFMLGRPEVSLEELSPNEVKLIPAAIRSKPQPWTINQNILLEAAKANARIIFGSVASQVTFIKLMHGMTTKKAHTLYCASYNDMIRSFASLGVPLLTEISPIHREVIQVIQKDPRNVFYHSLYNTEGERVLGVTDVPLGIIANELKVDEIISADEVKNILKLEVDPIPTTPARSLLNRAIVQTSLAFFYRPLIDQALGIPPPGPYRDLHLRAIKFYNCPITQIAALDLENFPIKNICKKFLVPYKMDIFHKRNKQRLALEEVDDERLLQDESLFYIDEDIPEWYERFWVTGWVGRLAPLPFNFYGATTPPKYS